jgi:hypothetical protein
MKYKSRHIFDADGKRYYQNGLKVLEKSEIKDEIPKMPELGLKRETRKKQLEKESKYTLFSLELEKKQKEEEEEKHKEEQILIQQRRKDMFKLFR